MISTLLMLYNTDYMACFTISLKNIRATKSDYQTLEDRVLIIHLFKLRREKHLHLKENHVDYITYAKLNLH